MEPNETIEESAVRELREEVYVWCVCICTCVYMCVHW